MPCADTLTTGSRFLGLFIGPSGSGKTPAACSFITDEAKAAGRRVRVFDFDGRIRGLLGCPWVDRSVVDYDYYPPRMPGTVFAKLNKDLEALQVQCNLNMNVYDTIVVDSLTTQTFAFLCDSIPLTHSGGGDGKDKKKGRSIGTLLVEGMDDYKFESTGTYSMLAFFRSLPVKNVIFTAHIIDRYGKPTTTGDNGMEVENPYAGSVIVGERLSLRDKLAANIPGLFDHVFRFERKMVGNEPHFYVRFWSDLARTVFQGMPLGDQDVTNQNFYKYLMGLTKEVTASSNTSSTT